MKRFYSQALGCRVNQAEKIAIDNQLIEHGFIYSQDNPDLVILNTCTVTHKADRESRQLVYQLKKKFASAKLVVTGCAATSWLREKLDERLPIDLIVDNQSKSLLVKRVLDLYQWQNGREINKNFVSDKYLSSKRIIIKIQDGCHRFCSFCIVPYLRGLPQSCRPKMIIKEINLAIQKYQIKEVILTAINTEAYGRDIKKSLVDLLKEIINETSVPRISFGSIHPWSINDSLLNFYKKSLSLSRLVDFFHIPLQSGSNRILKLMKRGYEIEEYEEKLNAIKKINSRSFLATDIIVGFLNETEAEFDQTYQFLKRSPLVRFHVFRYSPRKGTASSYLGKSLKLVDEKTKVKWASILRELSHKKYHSFLQSLVDGRDQALILNKKIDYGYWEGLLSNQVPIVVKADEKSIGEIKWVKIELYKKGKLFGKII